MVITASRLDKHTLQPAFQIYPENPLQPFKNKMQKNKSQRKNAKKSEQINIVSTEQHANASAFSKSFKQISVWIGLAASVAGVVGLLFTYVSIDEPDIRYLPNANPARLILRASAEKTATVFTIYRSNSRSKIRR
jgi:hypothetical protein